MNKESTGQHGQTEDHNDLQEVVRSFSLSPGGENTGKKIKPPSIAGLKRFLEAFPDQESNAEGISSVLSDINSALMDVIKESKIYSYDDMIDLVIEVAQENSISNPIDAAELITEGRIPHFDESENIN